MISLKVMVTGRKDMPSNVKAIPASVFFEKDKRGVPLVPQEQYDYFDNEIYKLSNGEEDITTVKTVFSDGFEFYAYEAQDGKIHKINEIEAFKRGFEGKIEDEVVREAEEAIRRNSKNPEKEKTASDFPKKQAKKSYSSVRNVNEIEKQRKKDEAESSSFGKKLDVRGNVTINKAARKTASSERKAAEAKVQAKLKEDLVKEKVKYKQLLEKEKDKYRAQLEQKKQSAIKSAHGHKLAVRANKTSYKSKLQSARKSIPYGKAGSISNLQLASDKTYKFINQHIIKVSTPADVLVTNKKYKMPKIVENATIANYGKLKRVEMQKAAYFTWRGCLACATFFQLLVSRTPYDEKYTYTIEGVGSSKPKFFKDKNTIKTAEEALAESNVGIRTYKKTHKPDKSYIRGDWVITFRGKTFKAFETEPAENSKSVQVDYTFTKDLFWKTSDQSAIEKIADKMFELTKDSGDLSSDWSEDNLNPRWQFLEFGGYYTHESTVAKGAKYTHRVDSTLLSYQAPYGFWRISKYQWEDLVTSGRWKGTVENYVNTRKNKLDVSKIESVAMKNMLAKHPDLKNFVTRIGVYK